MFIITIAVAGAASYGGHRLFGVAEKCTMEEHP